MLREDQQFLNKKLKGQPRQKYLDLKGGYKREFIAGMDDEPLEHRKHNAGRCRANTWLRNNTREKYE